MAISRPSIPLHVYVFVFIKICITIANPGCQTAADSFRDRLHNDARSIEIASTDYGNIFHNKSSYVLNPSSVTDVIDLIRSFNYTTISARGRGHSVRGQAMTVGGVVVNMTALNKADGSRIKVVVNDTWLGSYAYVGGEQLWVDVLRATLKFGLAPVSWTDYLYLSVGGTLSNAGISGQAFKHGSQISNVLQLDVVTGVFDITPSLLRTWCDDEQSIKSWKNELHLFWEAWGGDRDTCPIEFKYREYEWNWLCVHFNDPNYKTTSTTNKTNHGRLTEYHSLGSRSSACVAHEAIILDQVDNALAYVAKKIYPQNIDEHSRRSLRLSWHRLLATVYGFSGDGLPAAIDMIDQSYPYVRPKVWGTLYTPKGSRFHTRMMGSEGHRL
ncbi:Cytokinin dehydrogenase [Orobanche hederae]